MYESVGGAELLQWMKVNSDPTGYVNCKEESLQRRATVTTGSPTSWVLLHVAPNIEHASESRRIFFLTGISSSVSCDDDDHLPYPSFLTPRAVSCKRIRHFSGSPAHLVGVETLDLGRAGRFRALRGLPGVTEGLRSRGL
jgi:hypothetical protein